MLSLVSRKDKDLNNSSRTNKNTTALQLLKKDQRLQQIKFYKKYSLPELLFVGHTSL